LQRVYFIDIDSNVAVAKYLMHFETNTPELRLTGGPGVKEFVAWVAKESCRIRRHKP